MNLRKLSWTVFALICMVGIARASDRTDLGSPVGASPVPPANPASISLDYTIDASATATQVGRIFRDGVASTCATPKPFAPNPGDTDAYRFIASAPLYNQSASAVCATITVTPDPACDVNVQPSAYLGSFNPADISQNYLGDAGVSFGGALSPLSFEVMVPAGAAIVVNLNDAASPAAGVACTVTVSSDQLFETPANSTQFCNAAPIAIPDDGLANPYPSSTVVSGLGSSISRLDVQLLGLSHTFPNDIDILLVGPTGASMIVQSDIGGGTDVAGLNLTYSDSAAALPLDDGQLGPGLFKPSDAESGDAFAGPAPLGPYGDPAPIGAATLASVFAGTNPNGPWDLYIVDDLGGDTGSLSGGWCVVVRTAIPGSFPLDENFDEQTAPALPTDWPTTASGAGVPWQITPLNVDTPPNAAYAPEFPDVSDMALDSPAFTPVQNQTLSFRHGYNLETPFDGAVLEISINGSVFQDVLAVGGGFASGGYDAAIDTCCDSPIAGRLAWTGNPSGFVTTVVNLPPAAVGLPTALRWRTADDSSVIASGDAGWWVDTIQLSADADGLFCSGFEDGEDGSCGGVATDLAPGAWATATTGPAARYRAGAASDGTNVYIFGGGDGVGGYLADVWKWNAATETWTQLADMPTGKQNIQGTYLNGRIYVPGGYNGAHITENAIYDIATNSWTTGAPLPVAHTGATAAYAGKIYDFGGNTANTRLDIYDPETNTWTQGADFPTSITYGRAITIGDYIYYVGGIASNVTTSDVWRYDPVADSYLQMASLQTPRTSEELMAIGNRIYAVNGGDSTFFDGIPLAETVEIYDIATDTWTYGEPTLTTTAASSGGMAGGKLMIMGGVDDVTYYDAVQVSVLEPE